jgi:hypothetical protein
MFTQGDKKCSLVQNENEKKNSFANQTGERSVRQTIKVARNNASIFSQKVTMNLTENISVCVCVFAT